MTFKLSGNKGLGIWQIDDCPSVWSAVLYVWDEKGGYFRDGSWTEVAWMKFDMSESNLFFHPNLMDDVWPMFNLKNIVKKLEERRKEHAKNV